MEALLARGNWSIRDPAGEAAMTLPAFIRRRERLIVMRKGTISEEYADGTGGWLLPAPLPGGVGKG
jgi:hypothetical protein